MTEQQTAAADVTTPDVNISDVDVDKFFASGGELEIETEKAKTQAQEETAKPENKAEEPAIDDKKAQEEKDFDRNYKAAMHEEREKRKQFQSELQEVRERNAKMEARFQQLVEKMSQPQQQEVSYEENPLEALRVNQEKINKHLEQQHKMTEAQQQQAQREYQKQQFIQKYQSACYEYAKENPEFKQAYDYLVDSHKAQFLAAGYSEAEATQVIIDDEMALAAKAFKDEVNPGERLFKIAKLRGYSGAKPTEQMAEPKIAADGQKKMEVLQKGIEASKTLNNAAGKAKDNLTLEALAEMDDEEFDKNWSKIIKV